MLRNWPELFSILNKFCYGLDIRVPEIYAFFRQYVFRGKRQQLPGTHTGMKEDIKGKTHGAFIYKGNELLKLISAPKVHTVSIGASDTACSLARIPGQTIMLHSII